MIAMRGHRSKVGLSGGALETKTLPHSGLKTQVKGIGTQIKTRIFIFKINKINHWSKLPKGEEVNST